MTWYYNNEGAADGPHDERTMGEFMVQKRIQPETLIWQRGAAEWAEVRVIAPEWWQGAPRAKKAAKPTPVTRPLGGDSDTRGLVPKAPVAEAEGQRPGLLKRLFGFGRKNS